MPERVSISLAQLRLELTALELRIVDRMNAAVAGKADESALAGVSAMVGANNARLIALEATRVTQDRIEGVEMELANLRSVSGYKKWLWAQTVALFGVAVSVVALNANIS